MQLPSFTRWILVQWGRWEHEGLHCLFSDIALETQFASPVARLINATSLNHELYRLVTIKNTTDLHWPILFGLGWVEGHLEYDIIMRRYKAFLGLNGEHRCDLRWHLKAELRPHIAIVVEP